MPGVPVVMHVCDKLGAAGASIHGVTRLLTWWFPVLRTRGYEPRLCVLQGIDQAREYLAQREIAALSFGRTKFDVRAVRDLIRTVKQDKPDILHLHGYGAWTFGRIAARVTRTPAVLHEHIEGATVPLLQRFCDRLLTGRDLTCVVSSAVGDFCINKRYIRPSNIRVIPNGIPLNEFETPTALSIKELRNQLQVDDEATLIGSVGRLDTRKGFEYLIRAIPAILREHPDTVVLLAGDGELEQSLKALAQELGVEDYVRFLGFWHDVRTLLAALEVVVVPSLSEGAPLSIIEAMAMGRPIVSTRVGGLTEIVDDNETALVVRPRDPGDIAHKVSRVIKDQGLAHRLGENCKHAAQRYDISVSANKVADIYDALLEHGRHTA